MSEFSTNVTRVPALPVARTVRTVVADLNSGRLHTNTRYGRRHQWKPEESEEFMKTLLKGDTLIDPISIGRHIINGRTTEPAVNGNNRLRSLRKFVNNQLGVRAAGPDGRIYTYYYSEVPPMEARVSGRVRPRVLSPEQRNAFDDYPILFNCRPDLTETQEIAWYRELNTSLHAHSTGHLLVADICDPPTQAMRYFADALIANFPAVKERISEPATPEDVNSLGGFLADVSHCEPNFMNDDDKRENVLLSHAVITNLLVNGMPYNWGEWRGVFSGEALAENARAMRTIFSAAAISDELRAEWNEPVKNKPYLATFYFPSYLLGPIAWSLGTRKPNAVATWVRFLSAARPGTIMDVYGHGVRDLKYDDGNPKKYQYAWERVCEVVNGGF
jgi:hypothetical protein